MPREPTEQELACLRVVASIGGIANHDHPSLAPFIDDRSTLSNPDIFNSCHDLGWLLSGHDDRTDDCYAYLTEAGRAALSAI